MRAPDPPALDYTDRAAVQTLLRHVLTQAADAVDAGLDATAAPSARTLGRAEARRIIDDARSALDVARTFAGLPLPGRGDPAGSGGSPAL